MDLTSREFFLTHHVLKKSGNTCSFRSVQALANLERKYDKQSSWFEHFFLVSGDRWEYPPRQVARQDFPARANWEVVQEEGLVRLPVTQEELCRNEIMRDWAAAHSVKVFMNALLSADSLRGCLPIHTALRRLGSSIPLEPTSCPRHKRPAILPVEGKGKKPRGSSSIESNFDDDMVPYARQSSIGVSVQRLAPAPTGIGVVSASSNQAAPPPTLQGQGGRPSPHEPATPLLQLVWALRQPRWASFPLLH